MDKDFEQFIEKNKQMNKILDDELDELMKEDPELKNHKKKNDESIDCNYML